MGDIGRLGGPRGDGAGAGGHDLDETGDGSGGASRAVGQEFPEDRTFRGGQFARDLDNMHELSTESAGGQAGGDEILKQLLEPEGGQGGGAAEDQHG